jgi:tape measure domain-containing protein
MSNPIQSHDLYTPGGKDMLALLRDQLLDIQKQIVSLDDQARKLKKTLSSGVTSPAKVVAAATEAERIASAKRLLLTKEQAQMQRIANTTMAQAAIQEQRLAAATSRTNIVRQREIDLANRQAKANTSHSSTLKGMIGSIRNLAYAYFSLGAATQVFSNILKQTKAIDTLNVAFKTTLGSTQAAAQAQEYLLDISERFGANLLGASQAYLKFSAASTQAGVSAQQTQDIFTSVTKASSILGLGAERTSYVFLALEQIMSKGRLSTEELRRQLGEHLPGAFGIAAEAMGVTTAKLTDMLKKGEIASTDFLPKFAKQLEKAYGIEQVERIDNLASAQERFNNQLTLLVKEFNLSETFKDFFNTLAGGVKYVRQHVDLFLALGKALIYVGTAWAAWNIGLAASAISIARVQKAMAALRVAMASNPIGVWLVAITALIGVFDLLIKKMDAATEFQKALSDATVKASAEAEFQKLAINRLTGSYKENSAKLLTLKKGTDEYNKVTADQQVILAELNRLGVEAIDINGDKIISNDELTASAQRYLDVLKLQIKEEALLNKLRDATTELSEIEAKLKANQGSTGIGEFGATIIDGIAGTTISDTGKRKRVEQLKAIIEDIDKQVRSDFEARQKLLAGGVVNPVTPTDPDDDGKKDKFDIDKERLALIFDDQQRELAILKHAYEEKRAEFIAHNEDTTLLDQKYRDDKVDILNKYIDIEQGLLDDAAERQAKAAKDSFEKATGDVKDYLDQRRKAIEAAEDKRQRNVDTLREEFDQRREHEQAIFDLSKHTAEEEADFKLRLQAEELNDEIQLHRIFGKVLNDEELARAIELRDRILAEIGKPNTAGEKEETDIFSLLGINFDSEDQKQVVVDALDFAKEQLSDFLDFQKEIIDQEIENADRKVAAAENNLSRQIALQAANQANNVAGAQAELAIAKKAQEEALKQRQKFQKTELALNTALEASNLGVAIAKTLATFPGPVGIALTAVMLGAFVAAKIKAFQLANKKTFRKGGYETIGGGSHESGNDTHVGGGNYAEKDESVGIFTAKATRKYKPTLKALVNAANKGTLENILVQDRRAIQGINMVSNTDIDTSLMEKRLTRLVRLSETKTFVDSKGRLVTIDRGRKTIINK